MGNREEKIKDIFKMIEFFAYIGRHVVNNAKECKKCMAEIEKLSNELRLCLMTDEKTGKEWGWWE